MCGTAGSSWKRVGIQVGSELGGITVGTKHFILSIAVLGTLCVPVTVSGQGNADRNTATIGGRAFFAVQVRDIDAATEWYAAALDLQEVRLIEDPAGRYTIRLMTRTGLTVELINQPTTKEAPGPRTFGLFKVGFTVEDIDTLYESLRERSVDVDDGIFHDSALGARSFVFRDIEGNRIQAFEECAEEC
jgi:catechol-2,3-dioxygenase